MLGEIPRVVISTAVKDRPESNTRPLDYESDALTIKQLSHTMYPRINVTEIHRRGIQIHENGRRNRYPFILAHV